MFITFIDLIIPLYLKVITAPSTFIGNTDIAHQYTPRSMGMTSPVIYRPFWIDNTSMLDYYYRMPITKTDKVIRNFFLGFIRLHILHHSLVGPLFGLDMIRELATHGYSLSPGTLYPILHGLERDGFLKSEKQIVRGKARKYYRITRSGQATVIEALFRVRELMDEIDIKS